MIQFCNKTKGTIAVFLTLILVPVFLLGGLTTDAARVYMSKVVISDSGEMAMNAALAQYETNLHDEYGLLVMEKEPQSMENELADYFSKSLNGTGIPGAEDYDRILQLISERFEAFNVEGSQIYKTEVEKQQILEYMKYRAPVCLTELVLEKLDQLKDVKAQSEAMTAQMDFGLSMEECHDTMEEALAVLKNLDADNRSYPSNTTIQQGLDSAQMDYSSKVSTCILMAAAISLFTDYADGGEAGIEDMANSFLAAAPGVIENDGTPENYFSDYLSAAYYREGVEQAGGIDKLWDKLPEEPDAQADPEGHAAWEAERDRISDLIDQYNSEKNRISAYPGQLETVAVSFLSSYYTELSGYESAAEKGKKDAEEAGRLLKEVQEKLQDAKGKWQDWSDKTGKLSNPGSMQESVDDYEEFFNSTGQQDAGDLEALMKKVEQDEQYYSEILTYLLQEKFYGQQLAITTAEDQYSAYFSQAVAALSGTTVTLDFDAGNYRSSYASAYEHAVIPEGCTLTMITDDAFYKRLQEYCESAAQEESEEEKSTAQNYLDQGADAGSAADSTEGYPDFDWTQLTDKELPSVLLSAEAIEASQELTSLGGGVGDKEGRKNAVNQFKDSINAATSFLDGIDRIVEENLENLYLSEYAMQLFSYYTVDKDGQGGTIPDEEVIGLSGYSLKEHKGYKGEVEYMLWGNSSASKNVQYTVMTIFGIRLLLNSFFAFTDPAIVAQAKLSAAAIAGFAPYLIPIVQVIIQLGLAGIETGSDIAKIKQGYGVTIFKTKSNWSTYPYNVPNGNTKGVTLDYSEFLRIFMALNMMSDTKEKNILGRIADCIQINSEFDITKGYTMLSVDADIKVQTSFMRKVSEMGSGGFLEDAYTVKYQSILGY